MLHYVRKKHLLIYSIYKSFYFIFIILKTTYYNNKFKLIKEIDILNLYYNLLYIQHFKN